MSELIKALEKTVPPSQADQAEAQNYIQEYITRDLVGFLKALSDVLFDENNPPVARAAAGLQLKNQLTSRDETLRIQQQERWRSLPEETRLHIRERVFQTLGTEVFRPSSAPQCLAYIAIVELPDRTWPNLVSSLAQNVTNPASSPQLRLASLEAIGYICQDVDQTSLAPEDLEQILSIIVAGMKDPTDESRVAAQAALLNYSDLKINKISKTHSVITFDKMGELLNVSPDYAERIVAQMIREERIKGYLDQIERVIHFDSKDVLQLFDEDILKLCSNINDTVEKICKQVPEEWWAANVSQR